MKVYILMRNIPYEGDVLIAVYEHEFYAEKEKKRLESLPDYDDYQEYYILEQDVL